jgi:hypothetical protein
MSVGIHLNSDRVVCMAWRWAKFCYQDGFIQIVFWQLSVFRNGLVLFHMPPFSDVRMLTWGLIRKPS